MKSLVLVLLLAGSASARVIMMPPVPRLCPSGETWADVSKCLAKLGKPEVLSEVRNAKLVRLTDTARIPGFYLYTLHGRTWRIGGMYETGASDYEISKLHEIDGGGRKRFRFDVSFAMQQEVMINDAESRPASTRFKVAILCSGETYRCTPIMTACDVYIDGRSRETFRGTLTFAGNVVTNTGDRRHASQVCREVEQATLF